VEVSIPGRRRRSDPRARSSIWAKAKQADAVAREVPRPPPGAGAKYGFTVSGDGVGTATCNVGSSGDAFGVANNTTMTVLDLLLATDAQAVDGVLYNGELLKRNEANSVYSTLNEAGGI
jgi:hypothetical protein